MAHLRAAIQNQTFEATRAALRQRWGFDPI
jgi:hypothetical protein